MSQIVSAKNVRALPRTDTDWEAHTMAKVPEAMRQHLQYLGVVFVDVNSPTEAWTRFRITNFNIEAILIKRAALRYAYAHTLGCN